MLSEGKHYYSVKISIIALILFLILSFSAHAAGEVLADITYEEGQVKPKVCVQLYNYFSNARYCQVYILGGGNRSSATVHYMHSDVRPAGGMLDMEQYVAATHIWGHGDIYDSSNPYSTVEWSDEKQVK